MATPELSRPSSAWRSSTTRLILIYGALFVVWSSVLVAVIHAETQHYLSRVVDQILEQRAHYLAGVDRQQLPSAMVDTATLDLRGVMAYGLFSKDGIYLSGNLAEVPYGLIADGSVHAVPDGVLRNDRDDRQRARALALRLPSGELLVLSRATSVIDQVGVILRQSLIWALSLTLIPGLIGGYLLSRGPLRRVRAMEAAVKPIVRGDLSKRLPVSGRRDELDLLASIVNTMLVELERSMSEVKGVCDNIAHDLRTPLTRLRAQLHRVRQQMAPDSEENAVLERCSSDVESLLARFAALLRISEMEDRRRRAGFGSVDVVAMLEEIHELYAPLAEDKGVALQLDLEPLAPIDADRELLIEAISNLLSNAIKFTPAGGSVRLHARRVGDGAKVCVVDTGPGIPAGERDVVLQRFYRGESTRQLPGSGLGLSIVSAIVRLHGFHLDIGPGDQGGTRVTLHCQQAGLGN
ncbi:sensor histidine kinase [Solimonas marina]|uniref:histidine kinase n=1 Tax=Solimonas marina TaxID=2714601 RepID=A0A970B7Y7_9GAMM|nr:HAMP domain-containing sensor histidine kinase [Solimonas marina]NKF24170.1 HAMP domain-containing histidine kinase [Solimonas marina]